MWIVEVALKRPYTFIVLALLLPLLGALTLLGTPLRPGMPVDIFPDIAIPIIAVNFNYAGMSPDDMSGRITAQLERYATTIVNDIEHVESQSYPGIAVIKLFFQPGVNIDLAMAQVTAFGQTVAAEYAARGTATADPQVQRLERPDPAAGACPATSSPRRSCSTSATR